MLFFFFLFHQHETRICANFSILPGYECLLFAGEEIQTKEDEVNVDTVFIGARVMRDPENWNPIWQSKLYR